MKIALAVYEFKNNDITFNIKQIEKAFAKYAEKVDLICFAESFLQGFDSLSWSFAIDQKIALPINGAVFDHLKEMTLQYQAALAIGYFELDDSKIYSSYTVIEKGEILCNYRRMSKHWKEYLICDDHYAEGDCPGEFVFRDQLFRIALCGDMFVFPEKYKTDGILLWPIYVNYPYEEFVNILPEYIKRAAIASDRALVVNALSQDPPSIGNAFAITDNQIVSALGFNKEGGLIW